MAARSQGFLFAAVVLAVLLLGLSGRPTLSDDSHTLPVDLNAELKQLAEDFNVMYHRAPIVTDLKGVRCTQKQTFSGFYERDEAGDYVQKSICETTQDSSGMFQLGYFDGEQRLTVENGSLTIYATYTPKGGTARPGPPAAVERLGNGIIFRTFRNPERNNCQGCWQSNDFFITRDGRHGSVRTFTGEPQNDDHFVEAAAPGK